MPRGVPENLEGRREWRAKQAAAYGERLRFYRLLRRMTMQQLADAAGCSLHTIWRAETGRNSPRHETEYRMAQALGVDHWALAVNPLPQTPEDLPEAPPDPFEASSHDAPNDHLGNDQEQVPPLSRAERRRKSRGKKRKKGR